MQWNQPYEDEHFNLFCSDIMKNFTVEDYLQKQISSASRTAQGISVPRGQEPDLPLQKPARVT